MCGFFGIFFVMTSNLFVQKNMYIHMHIHTYIHPSVCTCVWYMTSILMCSVCEIVKRLYNIKIAMESY